MPVAKKPAAAKLAKGASRAAASGQHAPGGFLVVGVGASAGGLDACSRLLDALPPGHGMAFILVQHLAPDHDSMMAPLLAKHTTMVTTEAADGMVIAPDHLYVIPPGTYLSVADGALRLTEPLARHGARLPFDHLLASLALAYGARAAAVVLSGTGADGSLGIKAIRENYGLIIAQSPDEAEYSGMPASAIHTGLVDLTLGVAAIPEALAAYSHQATRQPAPDAKGEAGAAMARLPEIIELVRARTGHDFALYKPGTLQRRTERRMAMAAIEADDVDRYIAMLRADKGELEQLAKDLLINVTSFFRDAKVFDLLEARTIPDLLRGKAQGETLRVWIAGCSSGEETYSLVILLFEALRAAKHDIKLQVFASDLADDVVAHAREGLYPESIAADVSAARLKRFFSKEDHGYRVLPELRSAVVFTRQDVLGDPPFSKLDLISCRNLLIYLQPEAQARVISLFHFALRENGILLLGSAETIGPMDGRFSVVSKSERIYRKAGPTQVGALAFTGSSAPIGHQPRVRSAVKAASRATVVAELCRQLVIDGYGPAAVLVNAANECLFHLGPTDDFLKVAPGRPVNDVLMLAREGVRTKLRSAIQLARDKGGPVQVPGGRVRGGGGTIGFSIAAQPVVSEGEALVFIAFIPDSRPMPLRRATPSADLPRVGELEEELKETRAELQAAIFSLESSSEEQKAINEEALSVSEEYQATNEELLASKEELQSLNEELTALNSQLQETLERQRTTSNDLQNVLYSTDVATLFLDPQLNIRFFTPATKRLFRVLDGDVGRPLSDLSSLAADAALPRDAKAVLLKLKPIEREIEAQTGSWYMRRIMPYRAQDEKVEGVVITFVDITERRRISEALGEAKREAQLATIAKSRFLAAASHDLRQPLQTLTLIHGLLARLLTSPPAARLLARLDETLASMSGMLNALLDINRIESGNVQAQKAVFPINDLLERMRAAFEDHANAKGVHLRIVPSRLMVHSDPALLEQMVRNLVSNALKYTGSGKVLLGCRRSGGHVRLEIWDTGVGIPADELSAIFDEYHQLDNAARERSRGLGLGLSIVKRLGLLLGHAVSVRSVAGSGSMFAVSVDVAPDAVPEPIALAPAPAAETHEHNGTILIVDDDPEILDLLDLILTDEGYNTVTAKDAASALDAVATRNIRPDLLLADYNLPGGLDGLQLAVLLRGRAAWQIPAIILTGDISTGTLRDIALHNCVQLSKPVKLAALSKIVEDLIEKRAS